MAHSDPPNEADAAELPASPPRSASDFPPGTSVGRYVVLQRIGEGGTGAVYAAYDAELDRRVALKVLRDRIAQGTEASEWRERLLREAKAMARLSHPNVVTLYDVGLARGARVFLAMEVVDGGTANDWLHAEKRSWRAIVSLFCEAGEGLVAAHGAGIVHRDFKLENVLVGKDGQPRVTDFGLARGALESGSESAVHSSARSLPAMEGTVRLSIRESPSRASSPSKLTLTGAMMGTPGYMAPEQYASNEEIDARADVFAFCATLYRALYGQRAFEGRTVEQIAEATILGKVRETPKGSDVPAWVRSAILHGLAVHREDRHRSMAELLAALRADPGRRRRRWVLAGGAIAAACVTALGVHAAGARRVRACHDMADRLGGVWDEERKGAIARAFQATGVSYAGDTWNRIEKRLDVYAGAWTSATDAACEATRVRGEQSEAMLDLRLACLDERRDELRALSDAFTHADAKTVEKAVQAASALTSVLPCANRDALSAATRLPSEPKARAEIRALQGEIADATELRLTGKQTQGYEGLERIRSRVEAAHFSPLLVAWTLAHANTDVMRDLKAAPAEYARAIELAESNHLDLEKGMAQVGMGRALDDLGRRDEAHLLFGFARATLARRGGDPGLEFVCDVYDGTTYSDESKYADAARLLEHAIARARTEDIDDPRRLAVAESFLGLALLADSSRFDEAVAHARTAVTIDEEAYGPENPVVAGMAANLAHVEEETGRLDEALGEVRRSLATFRTAVERGELSAQNQNLGHTLHREGDLLVRLGRPGEAAPLLENARGVGRANGETSNVVETDAFLAEALIDLGRPRDALQVTEEARALADKDANMDPQILVELLVVEATLALASGKEAEALARAERAYAVAQTGVTFLYARSGARLVLARALARNRSDPARARLLAEEASAGFKALHDRPRTDDGAAVLAQLAAASTP